MRWSSNRGGRLGLLYVAHPRKIESRVEAHGWYWGVVLLQERTISVSTVPDCLLGSHQGQDREKGGGARDWESGGGKAMQSAERVGAVGGVDKLKALLETQKPVQMAKGR